MNKLKRISVLFHRATLRALQDDCFYLSQSTAYSAIVSLFPALIAAAAIISLLPYTTPLRFQLSVIFDRILPPDVSPLLESYFVTSPHNPRSTHALLGAFVVSVAGASSVISALMEGVRRANRLPEDCWSFLERRWRSLVLVPLSLVPFVLASLLVVFGHFITVWLAREIMPAARAPLFLLADLVRWTVALAASTGIVAMIYHMGTPLRQPWKRVVPGAILATIVWFIATIVFGWYVTRFANYSQVYGPLGAAIALLIWLYLISFSVFFGAEFNAEYAAHFFPDFVANSSVSTPTDASARVE